MPLWLISSPKRYSMYELSPMHVFHRKLLPTITLSGVSNRCSNDIPLIVFAADLNIYMFWLCVVCIVSFVLRTALHKFFADATTASSTPIGSLSIGRDRREIRSYTIVGSLCHFGRSMPSKLEMKMMGNLINVPYPSTSLASDLT